LFSNANDLAKLMQMYLNGGVYAGDRFIEQNTLKEFTSCQYCRKDNRRGIGFDKPVIDDSPGPTCKQASLSSFGHSGFTGTLVWADPEHDLIYVFLSNRIHPSAENFSLVKQNIRTRIQEVIYKSIE
jgi:CubicO group peptidase (beta-lactamase class C family)